ncbi:MAG: SANT/Myb-like DNA-binding domain-containing protein [Oscillospiraceae bacterium]|nr:SANT/Myb-like DNA-binding domain-containing protein [Oscillospiraceae bacterium]
MLNEAQKHNIRLAVKGANDKDARIAQVARDFGITEQAVRIIVYGTSSGPEFTCPVPPMMERQAPTEWTNSETQQLRVMKEKGVANSEICKQLHKTAQQVSSKWYTLRKVTGKIKGSAEMLEKPAPGPTAEPTPQVKPVVITPPTFDLTAVKQPISEHMDIFDTLQEIMRQANAGYASVSITREDGTKLRAEVKSNG